jgi:hypothetical protein
MAKLQNTPRAMIDRGGGYEKMLRGEPGRGCDEAKKMKIRPITEF